MHSHHAEAVFDALMRIEAARQPITSRATLTEVLRQIAEEMRNILDATEVWIRVEPGRFDPPLDLTVMAGTACGQDETLLQHDLSWAGLLLATLTVAPAPTPAAAQPALVLLGRVIAETVAETYAAETLVVETVRATRRGVAHDIHDGVKQVLPAIRMMAERAERDLDRDPIYAAELLGDIREASQQALDELAFLLSDLRQGFHVQDLERALHRVLAQIASAEPQLEVTAHLALPALPWDVAACVLGVVRNALANVLQHAHARQVHVAIGEANAVLMVRVHDDGIGVNEAQAIAAPGIGLESMIERVETLGGHHRLGTALEGGTCLEVWIPLHPQEATYD